MMRCPQTIQHRIPAFTLIVITAVVLLACANRFIQDDAFISFRYAQNLIEGKGLVWNDGDRIEGYTNFLWTLLIAGAMYLGIPPLFAAQWTGLALFIVTLLGCRKILLMLLRSEPFAILGLILIGTNYTFSCYATGGLETQLQTALVTWQIYLMLRLTNRSVQPLHDGFLLSILASLSVLTRLDSVLIASICIGFALITVHSRKPLFIINLLVPFIIIPGIWIAWKFQYYGDIFPNTFYAKTSALGLPLHGFYYIYLFFVSYWLIPFLFFFFTSLFKMAGAVRIAVFRFVGVITIWCAYVMAVNGDFMEFRFMTPIIPAIFIIITIVLHSLKDVFLQATFVVMILAGSLHHFLMFGIEAQPTSIQTIQILSDFVSDPECNWQDVGIELGNYFDHDPSVVIATTAAGAIPYYSRLTCIDMLGLNDRWIAQHGNILGSIPGHQRGPTIDYLIRRKVNLVLGHPDIYQRDQTTPTQYSFNTVLNLMKLRIKENDRFPFGTSLVEIPIKGNHFILAIHFVQSERVQRMIETNNWKQIPLTMLR